MTSAETQTTPDPAPAKTASPLKKATKKATKKAAIVSSTIPALLTAEELKEIDTMARPSASIIAQVDSTTKKESAALEQQSQQLDKQRTLLNTELTTVISNDTNASEDAKPLEKREEAIPVSVEAEDGMYFDSVTGTAVYQKNVVVIHPQMHLTCSDELKVFLKEAPQQENRPKQEGDTPEFDGLDKAIAIGNVVIRAKDSEGKPIITHSEIATYDGDTGIIILKGGRPTVQQGSQIARVLSDSGYIKILPNMSVRIEGKHEIEADLNELQN